MFKDIFPLYSFTLAPSTDNASWLQGLHEAPSLCSPIECVDRFLPKDCPRAFQGDLLLLASDHLVTNVVRDDGDFNFNITIIAT